MWRDDNYDSHPSSHPSAYLLLPNKVMMWSWWQQLNSSTTANCRWLIVPLSSSPHLRATAAAAVDYILRIIPINSIPASSECQFTAHPPFGCCYYYILYITTWIIVIYNATWLLIVRPLLSPPHATCLYRQINFIYNRNPLTMSLQLVIVKASCCHLRWKMENRKMPQDKKYKHSLLH